MAIYFLNPEDDFPPEEKMEADAPIAVSEELDYLQLKRAYTKGIFPWYNPGELVQWWCPDPRFVLFPENLRISHSMKTLIRSGKFTCTINQAFSEVIHQCASIPRKGQNGTWLTPELMASLNRLHEEGWAHSCEVWKGSELVGGLYGILQGKVFFGESMFARESNASKAGFIHLVRTLQARGIHIIDCQYYSEHLERLGAEFMPRKNFLKYLERSE
jgi:leucyl/phenylalanyl-tRNA--protein transferase